LSHYLKPTSGGSFPRTIIAVGWEPIIDRTNHATGKPCIALRVGDVALCRITLGKNSEETEYAYVPACVNAWDRIERSLIGGRSQWLVAFRLYDFLVASDWFGRLDKGEWSLGQTINDYGEIVRPGTGGIFAGFHCFLDPPTVVLSQHLATRSTVMMVDYRNWCQGRELKDMLADEQCDLLTQWIIDYIALAKKHGWKKLCPTAAGQSWHTFRGNHMTHEILVHGQGGVTKLERSAYIGGRLQTWRIGEVKESVYHYDFSSFYPMVVANAEMPARLRKFWPKGPPDITQLADSKYAVIADVTVYSIRGLLPCRDANGTYYPRGRWRVTLCGPELTDAYKNCEIVDVHSAAIYYTDTLFSNFVDSMTFMRNHAKACGNPMLEQAIKRVANSLFGRFSRRLTSWVPAPEVVPVAWWAMWQQFDVDTGEAACYRSMAGVVEKQLEPVEDDDSLPCISAWVTSLGRNWLARIIRDVGFENMIYCDTDSVFVTLDGKERIELSKSYRIGLFENLRFVDKYDSLRIDGLRSYVANGKTVQSGRPLESIESDIGVSEWDSVESLWSAMRQCRPPSSDKVHRSRKRPNNGVMGMVLNGVVTPPVLNGGI
jgi:DNA polymerase type B, organellar and viral